MNARHCTQCGERQTIDARFCPRCGASLPTSPVAAEVDPLIGTVVADRYRLLERIGRGASGAIYRAEHATLKRPLAIKILHPHHAKDEAAVERFRREATTIGQIDNDHLLQISDFGTTSDHRLFFAMELLEGETLDAVLAREGKLDPARATRILLQISDALGVAHEHGYIHRDVRPRNVFLAVRRGEKDFVKLLDFALAKLAQPEVEMRQTSMGMTFGDPRYMSPEQASGNALDARSDIFSLGIVAFQMLTGTVPFDGTGPIDVLQKILDNPTPRIVGGDTPEWLRAIVERALQKTPSDRFADMKALAECLSTETAPPPIVVIAPATAPVAPSPAPVTAAVPRVVPDRSEAATAPVRPRTLIMETALPASVAAASAAPATPPAHAETAPPATPPSTTPLPARDDATPLGFVRPAEAPAPQAVPAAETVAGELRNPTAARAAEAEAPPSVVIEAGYIPARDEPTGPQRIVGNDGWFRDKSSPGLELYEEDAPKKTKGLGLIGIIAGGISLAAIGTIALWPKPHAASKQSPEQTTAAVSPATAVPAPVEAQPQATPAAAQPSAVATPPSAAATPPSATGTPPEPPKPEPVKVEPPKVEPPKPEPPKPEPVKVEPPKPEPVKVAAPKPEPKAPEKVAPPVAAPKAKPTKPPAVVATLPPEKPAKEPATKPRDTTPKGFSDPFTTAVSSELDTLVKSGRQRLASGDLSQAQAAFTKAKALDGRSADAYAGLGEVAFEQGDYATATSQLKQAVKLSPNRARFLVLLGQSYYKSGHAKEAAQEYRRALRIDPTNQEAQRSLELAEKKIAQGG